jgi:signal transduction histidine kinase
MNSIFLGYIGVFSLSALVCLGSLPRARDIQHKGTREGLLGLLLSVGIWSGGYVGYFLAPTVGSKLAFYTLGFVFAFVAVGAFLYFCAAYTGRPPREAPYRNIIIAVFLVFIALKVTNPLHHLYFTSTLTTEPFPHLAIQHQLLYWVLLGLSYAVIAVGFFMLFERFYHTGADSRPLVVLAGLTAVPTVATILGGQLDWLLPLMYEPPGVALFAVGTLFVYLNRFEAIRMTSGTPTPAIFLDADSCVRDYNQAARDLFPGLQGSIGIPLEEVSQPLARHLNDTGILMMTHGGDSQYYQVAQTPITSGEVVTGQLVTVTDVTERESYRQRLEVKTEQLEALNRVVRHDIRNDMAVIHGWADTLHDHVDDDGVDALDRVLLKSQHVIELTETVRDFVDSLADDSSLELKPIPLRRQLETELTAVRTSYPDAHVSVDGEIPDTTVAANELLASVFRNILENAIRHTDAEPPEVTVSCVEHPNAVQIRFADNGPGIPDGRKEEIFGKGEKGMESPGSGIGLYLVATLTEQFGGQVWIEDNDPQGAVFVVELEIFQPANIQE